MIRIATAVLLVAAAAAAAHADPFAGSVLDGESLEPIADATVSIEDGSDRVQTTDVAGRFRFDDVAPGVFIVRIEAEGYEPTTERIELAEGGQTDRILVVIKPGSTVETVEIIGKAPLIVETPGQTQLDREELVKMPGTRGDAMQVIKSLPGVANADAVGTGPGLIVIRGAAPEDSIFLLDGVQIPLVYHFFGLQSVIPSEFIDDIEFLPGGFGVENGRATGGIVHIKTRPSRSTEWNGFAEASFINVAGYVEGPAWKEKNLQVSAAFRRSTIDLLLPAVIPEDSGVNFTTAPQYYDAQLRLDWFPAKGHRVAMMGLISYDLLKLLSENENPNDPAATGTFFNETAFWRVMPSWRYKSRRFENTAQMSIGGGDFRIEIGADRFLEGDRIEVLARDDFKVRLTDRLTLRTGVDTTLYQDRFSAKFPLPPQEGSADMPNLTTDPLVLVDSTFPERFAAAYVAVDLKPVKALKITPGLRYDYYYRIDQDTVSPRLNMSYKFDDKWTGRMAMGSYSRPLEQGETLNRNLVPELATQYVAGAEYDIRRGLQATTSVFYTDRRRLVTQDQSLIVDDTAQAYINRAYGQSYGWEIMLRAKRDDFFGWAAYTLSKGTRVDGPGQTERLFDYDQTHNFIAVASWQWRKWTFGGKWQYTTGEPDTPIEGSIFLSDLNAYVPVFGEVNSDRIENAHQLDVRIDRKWMFDTWELSAYLDVQNVYAHARTLGYQYSFDYMEREAFTTLPILPAIGVRGTF